MHRYSSRLREGTCYCTRCDRNPCFWQEVDHRSLAGQVACADGDKDRAGLVETPLQPLDPVGVALVDQHMRDSGAFFSSSSNVCAIALVSPDDQVSIF